MEQNSEKKINRRHNGRIAAGVILIVFGAATLLQRWLDIGNYIVLLLGFGMLIWGSVSHRTGWIIPGGVLTGIGLGVLLGLADPLFALVGFALLFGVGILALHRVTRASMDTIISLGMSFSIALGVVLLSRGGSFNRYSHYLIGDLLSITPREIGWLCVTVVIVAMGF